MTTKFPLPSPYEGNTPQDHIDALTDHADLRLDGPLLDYLAMAAADLIGRQQAEIAELTEKLQGIEGVIKAATAYYLASGTPDEPDAHNDLIDAVATAEQVTQ